MTLINRSGISVILILSLLFTVIAGSTASGADWWPFGKGNGSGDKKKKQVAEVVINEAPLSRKTQLTTSFSSVIHSVSPSVVSIKTAAFINPQQMHPFFREFFKIPEEAPTGQRRLQPRGIGSGVIVSKDGYILTNNHVIADADEILVDFNEKNGKEYPATIVGTDPRSDLAVLKIEIDKELPSAILGNSDQIEVGDIVLALGNPFGLGQTVTMGIISATGRNKVIPQQTGVIYQDFIQTDASINQGNSGGALVDAEGRLIGINTAIFSRTGENLGIGFAVPINMARTVMQQLIEQGRVSRGYLGVNIDEVNSELAESFGLESEQGALITFIESGSPAEKAGLKRGDVILKINQKDIHSVSDLLLTVSQQAPGSVADVHITRGGKTQIVKVTLSERPDETAQQLESPSGKKTDEEEAVGGRLFSGIMVQDITAAARTQLSIPEDVNGALVTRVETGSLAEKAGMRRGMVILEITADGQTKVIERAQDAIRFSRTVKGKSARIYAWTPRGYTFIILK
ncbi:MAG: Do family serine endopeptidase [Candidatus Methylacidiphilales bacterium]